MPGRGDVYDAYVRTVGDRLDRRGFEELAAGPPDYETTAYGARELSLTSPGIGETVAVVAEFETPAVPTVREFSARAFAFARERTPSLPLGLGSTVLVYPVAACRDPAADLKEWVAGYRPGHWRAVEFPVVADLAGETVHYYSDTPLFRARSYGGYRETAATVFDPATADLDMEGL